MEVQEHHAFRVTRNADLSDALDEADDLLSAVEYELRRADSVVPPASRSMHR